MSDAATRRSPGGHRSRFGGLWTDLRDAEDELARRVVAGAVPERWADPLRAWIRDGYLVLEGAVPGGLVDAVRADVEAAWRGELPRCQVEFPREGAMHIERPAPELRAGDTKLLSLHAESAAAREAILALRLLEFLTLVFERPPLAFSTLGFDRGTRQPIHQDTAYVQVKEAPLEMVASWIALEDVVGDCGALEYYIGSHRIPEPVFPGDTRLMPQELLGDDRYHLHLRELCVQAGCELREFRPRRGDVLLWNADLVHGGKREVAPGTTRRSLVTHYCPADREPAYFDYWENSGALEHAPGAFYSWYQR